VNISVGGQIEKFVGGFGYTEIEGGSSANYPNERRWSAVRRGARETKPFCWHAQDNQPGFGGGNVTQKAVDSEKKKERGSRTARGISLQNYQERS